MAPNLFQNDSNLLPQWPQLWSRSLSQINYKRSLKTKNNSNLKIKFIQLKNVSYSIGTCYRMCFLMSFTIWENNFPVGNAFFHVGNGMFSIGCYFQLEGVIFLMKTLIFNLEMTVSNWNKSFQIGKSSYSIGKWQLPIGAWSFPFVKCNVQWEEKHISLLEMQMFHFGDDMFPIGHMPFPIGNVIFELEVKRFIWNTNFYFENVIFQFENQVTRLENDNLQLEQYRSEGCARTAYFCSWARWEEGRFRIPVSVATRPDPTRPDRPFRPDPSPIEKCRFGTVGFGPFRALPGQEFLPWGWSLSENHRFYKKTYMIVWEILRFS